MQRIAIAAHKGGAGKSTVSVNLGGALADQGARVLVIDADPQGAVGATLGIPEEKPTLYEVLTGQSSLRDAIRPTAYPRLDVLPADIDLSGSSIELPGRPDWQQTLRQALRPLRNYDVVLIDTAPGLDVLPYIALTAADHALLVCSPDYVTFRSLPSMLETVHRARLHLLGIVVNRISGRTRIEADVLTELRARHGDQVLVEIPRRVNVEEAGVAGQPLSVYAPLSPTGQAFARLAEKVNHALTT